MCQEAQRWRVGPLQIVDGEQQRTALRQVHGQPIETVQRAIRRHRRATPRSRLDAKRRRRASAAAPRENQPDRSSGVVARHRDRRRVAHHAPREFALEVARRDAESTTMPALAARAGKRSVEQRCLPDPGVALDQDSGTCALLGASDQLIEGVELVLPLQ